MAKIKDNDVKILQKLTKSVEFQIYFHQSLQYYKKKKSLFLLLTWTKFAKNLYNRNILKCR